MFKLLVVVLVVIGLLLTLRWLIRRAKVSGILPILVILLLVAPGLVAFAPMQEVEPDPVLWAVITQFLTMGRFAALVAIQQGKGIGRRLVTQALQYGKHHGARKAFLAVDEENLGAIRLYESLGFVVSKEPGEINMVGGKT